MNRASLVGAVSFAALAVALILGISAFGGEGGEATPLVTTVIGFLGLAINQILGTKNVTETKDTVDQVKDTADKLSADLHNGTLERLVREAIQNIAADRTTSLEIKKSEEGK